YLMQSLLTSEIFGVVSFGSIFGLILLAAQAGSGLGPLAVGILEDATGSYTSSFVVTAIVTFIAGGVVLLARPVAPHSVEEAREAEAAG
ncbi:MAG: hypothetical protein KC472_08870, partial [Dehalococcoidia bacterium]|nr:hypothetical protein [Dehalococcoidia bacterium]